MSRSIPLDSRVFIAGHRGLVGSAIVRRLTAEGFTRLAELVFDTTKPDGMPRKLLDVSRLHALGWRSRIPLREGVARTCDWFASNYESALAGSRALLRRPEHTEPEVRTASSQA